MNGDFHPGLAWQAWERTGWPTMLFNAGGGPRAHRCNVMRHWKPDLGTDTPQEMPDAYLPRAAQAAGR